MCQWSTLAIQSLIEAWLPRSGEGKSPQSQLSLKQTFYRDPSCNNILKDSSNNYSHYYHWLLPILIV